MCACSGIPGVGKSTAMKRLNKSGFLHDELRNCFPEEDVRVIFVKEATKLWRERGWLQTYYEDPSMNAAAFQWIAFQSHVSAVEEALQGVDPSQLTVVITERSMYDQMIFWKEQVGNATASPIYCDAYEMTWSRWRRFIPEPDVIFYFRTSDIQHTMHRVRDRARAEELGSSYSPSASVDGTATLEQAGGIKLEYQARLLARHDAWYTSPNAHPTQVNSIPCTIIDADTPYHTSEDALRSLAAIMAQSIVREH